MDVAASDELLGELLDLTRRLRGQLARHAALGAWAAPGGAGTRIAEAVGGEAEPGQAPSDAPEPPVAQGATAVEARRTPGPAAEPGRAHGTPAAPQREPHVGAPRSGDLASGAAFSGAVSAGARRVDSIAGAREAAEPRTPPGPATGLPRDPHAGAGDLAAGAASRGAVSAGARRADAVDGDPVEPGTAHTPGDAPVALGRRTLPEIRAELGDCTRCKLHSTRRSIVFGVGASDTPLMFVGEAPGEQEDRRGEPFVGPAGQLLDKMIEAMGWTRAAVYIANTTKCRPPGNRNPQPDELAQCMPFLHAQIAAIAPRIIVALGRPAANQLLGTDAPISALRGRFHDHALPSGGVRLKIMPTFHPAYLLRDPSKKRTAWEDLKLVMAELERLGIAPPAAPRG
jgi:DNA polymerase